MVFLPKSGEHKDFSNRLHILQAAVRDFGRFRNALRHSPSRHLVEADVSPLLVSVHSLAEFKAAIAEKSGHSAGGPTGLLYDHIKCWSPPGCC